MSKPQYRRCKRCGEWMQRWPGQGYWAHVATGQSNCWRTSA